MPAYNFVAEPEQSLADKVFQFVIDYFDPAGPVELSTTMGDLNADGAELLDFLEKFKNQFHAKVSPGEFARLQSSVRNRDAVCIADLINLANAAAGCPG